MSIKYSFTADMRPITSVGSDYEENVHAMVIAALIWLDDHPKAQPLFYGMKGVKQDNDDARGVFSAMEKAVPDSSGSMQSFAVSTVLYIRKLGWEAYCQEMRGAKS